jgi:hypothetical protein
MTLQTAIKRKESQVKPEAKKHHPQRLIIILKGNLEEEIQYRST